MRNEEQWRKIEEAKELTKNLYQQINKLRSEVLEIEEQLKTLDVSKLTGVECLMYMSTVTTYNEHKANIKEMMEMYNTLTDWLNSLIAQQIILDNL